MTEQMLGTYTVLPMVRSEIEAATAQVARLLEALAGWTLTTPEDEEQAAQLLTKAHKRWKELEAVRKKALQPALTAQRDINDFFRPALDGWESVKDRVKKLLNEAVRAREAANQALLLQASKGDGAALAQVQETAPPSGIGYRDEVEIVIDDFDSIPRDCLTVDWSKLKIMARLGQPAPPGVRFVLKKKTVVAGRHT